MRTREWERAVLIAAVLVATDAPASAGNLSVSWSALRPTTQGPARTDIDEAETATGEVLSQSLGGKAVTISGYLLPVDRDGPKVYEFILMPLSGLCSHMPPPPANQAVHVFPVKPFSLAEIYEPVAVSGVLEAGLDKTQLMMIDGAKVIESGYTIGQANVSGIDGVPDGGPPRKATPWSFLNK